MARKHKNVRLQITYPCRVAKQPYAVGSFVEVDENTAKDLVGMGRAVRAPEAAPAPAAVPVPAETTPALSSETAPSIIRGGSRKSKED